MIKLTKLKVHTPEELKEFQRKADEVFKRLQPLLMPEHADEIIAIEPYSGEYVLDRDRDELYRKFREKFPDKLARVIRVDGGPVVHYTHRIK